MLSDIEIAKNSKLKNILEIAEQLDITQEKLKPYGNYIAKIDHR